MSSSSSSNSRMEIVCQTLEAEINLLYIYMCVCVYIYMCVRACVYVNAINTSQRTQSNPIRNTSR